MIHIHNCLEDCVHLTILERKIIAMLARGAQTEHIGAALDRSPYTIRNTITRIFGKLQVETRAELMVVALRQGVIT